MAIPVSETYQHFAFMMGIISQNENVQANLYNSYINVYLRENDWGETTLEFSNATCEDYRLQGIGEMDLYYVKNIEKSNCIGFFKERIDQDNYLLLFRVDEYEISYSKYYHKTHFFHDTYVFGYDEDCFDVMAYKDGHLSMMKVPQREIVDGIYTCLEFEDDIHFCSFRVFHKARIEINTDEILRQVDKYLTEEENENGNPSGITTYRVLQDALAEFYRDDNNCYDLDVKLFRMLWEHKKMIVLRNQKLGGMIRRLQECDELAHRLEQMSSTMMLMVIKYNVSHDLAIVKRIINQLNHIKNEEVEYWNKFREIVKDGI